MKRWEGSQMQRNTHIDANTPLQSTSSLAWQAKGAAASSNSLQQDNGFSWWHLRGTEYEVF